MARTKNPSYLQRRGNVWYAVLDIPKPLRRHFDDKPRFVQSLKTEIRSEAERLKLTVIASWKAEIEAARTGRLDAHKDLDQSALDWRIGYQSSNEYEREIAELEIDSTAWDIAHRDREQADAFYMVATGRSFPIGKRIEEWLSTRKDTPKSKDMKRTDLKRFAERFKYTHEVTKQAVRKWVQELEHQKGYKLATIQRMISPCRGYWEYLQRSDYIPDDTNPFEGAVKREKRKTKAASKSGWVPFTPEDVVRLVEATSQSGDQSLGQLIWLAMWTGCRIEELCSLRCSDVEATSFQIVDAKSDAGNRLVPIHSRLSPVVRFMVSVSEDGYVLSGLTKNKYGDRSNAIGKRFGRLKSSLGFDGRHVFHSIRKTVATQLENASVQEPVAADILGHDKPTMTYGIYSGGTNLKLRQEAIEKLSYPLEGTPEFLMLPAPTKANRAA